MQDQKRIEELRKKIEESEPQYLEWVKKLVNIDTDTGNFEGSLKVSEILKDFFQKLGGKVETRKNDRGVHVIARFSGTGKKNVLLYDHTDTVLPNHEGFHFRYDEKTKIAYGPGTSDSKGSVAFVMQLVQFLKTENLPYYRELIVYLDAEEEVGSEMEDALIEELSKEVDYAIVADGGRPGLGIVTRRKTLGTYEIEIHGMAGHAGNGAQSSASAVTQAGYLITALDALASSSLEDPRKMSKESLNQRNITDHGQFIPENTINVGVFSQSPSAKVNIIEGYVKLKLELRCFEQSEHERLEKAIFDLAKSPYRQGITIHITGRQEYQSVEAKGVQKQLVDLYSKIGKTVLGKEIPHWQAGGVTPGNLMALHTSIIDGVGVDADPALEHSINEELYVDTYVPRTLLLLEFLREADKL